MSHLNRQIMIKKVVDDALKETLNDFPLVGSALKESVSPDDCKNIEHTLKNELELMRSFVGTALIYYHFALREALQEQGIDLPDLV